MIKQQVHIGEGSIKELLPILELDKPNSIFLVTGKSSYEKCGAKNVMYEILKGFFVTRYFDFEENPKIEDVQKAIELYNKKKCDYIIAIGGGSAIDMAKMINVGQPYEGILEDVIEQPRWINSKAAKLIAIPTTSGTGSEATQFAVYYVNKVKYSADHQLVLPDVAIIDVQFTYSLPPFITATTGIDALSQAIEGFWSVKSTDEAKKYAKEAIKIIWEALPLAVQNNKQARIDMAKGSYLAGKTINIARTTAAHAISYPFTSYFALFHGHAVAITLPNLILYNYEMSLEECNDKRGMNYVKKKIEDIVEIVGCSSVKEFVSKLDLLIKNIGIDISREQFNFKKEENINLILDNVNLERLGNNPRKLDKNDVREIILGSKQFK